VYGQFRIAFTWRIRIAFICRASVSRPSKTAGGDVALANDPFALIQMRDRVRGNLIAHAPPSASMRQLPSEEGIESRRGARLSRNGHPFSTSCCSRLGAALLTA